MYYNNITDRGDNCNGKATMDSPPATAYPSAGGYA
jgi:hypothetical protein